MASEMTGDNLRNFWVLTAGQFLHFFGFFFFFQFPLFIQSVGGGEQAIGLMMGLQSLASTILLPWISPLMARTSLKSTILGGTALVCVTTLACLTLDRPNIWMAILMILRGLGFTLFINASGTYVARIVPAKERSRWIGINFGFNQVAIAAGPAIGEFAILRGGFNAFFLTALAVVFAGFLMQLRIAAIPAGTHRPLGFVALPVHFFRTLATRRLFFLFLTILPLASALGTVFSFTATFLRSLGLSSGLFFLVYAVLNALSRFGGGGISDRLGRGRVILPSLALLAGGVFLYSTTDGMAILLLSAAIIGLGFGFCNPALSAQMLDEAPPDSQNIAVGGFQFGFNLGMIVSTPLMGVVADRFGYGTMYRAAALIGVFAVLIYSAGVMVRRRHPAPNAG